MRLGAQSATPSVIEDPAAPNQPKSGDDPALDRSIERNMRSISAINRQRGVKTIWVRQLVNPDRLTGEGFYGWVPLVRDRDVWPLLQKFNAGAGRHGAQPGRRLYRRARRLVQATADFVDNGHFSPQGAQRFAEALAPMVRDACR